MPDTSPAYRTSKEADDGGPAFGHGDHTNGGDPGMSKRDWFAGQIIAGRLAEHGSAGALEAVSEAYRIADMMIAAPGRHDWRAE